MPLTRGRSIRFGGFLHRDSIGAAPSGAAPNFSPRLDRGPVRVGLGHAQVDRATRRAGTDLELDLAFAELRPLAEQELPATGGAADPELLDAEAVERRSAPEAAVPVAHLARALVVHLPRHLQLPGDLRALRERYGNDERTDEPGRDEQERRIGREGRGQPIAAALEAAAGAGVDRRAGDGEGHVLDDVGQEDRGEALAKVERDAGTDPGELAPRQ